MLIVHLALEIISNFSIEYLPITNTRIHAHTLCIIVNNSFHQNSISLCDLVSKIYWFVVVFNEAKDKKI